LGKLRILDRLQEIPNFYSRYKIYGTSEVVTSEVCWDTSEPDLNHRMIFPVTFEMMVKMAKVPFIIEFWNKIAPNNKLLGVLKLNLSNIPGLALSEDQK
jgi:hypothetical protein